jgi:hypothetical protein
VVGRSLSKTTRMLVFRHGTWVTVNVPLSDPTLTPGHKRFAAAVAASALVRGASPSVALAAAEQRLYEDVVFGGALGVSGKQHDAQKN